MINTSNRTLKKNMGYTGALYKDFLGGASGILFTIGIMFLWIVLPLYGALRIFRKKDL